MLSLTVINPSAKLLSHLGGMLPLDQQKGDAVCALPWIVDEF